MIHIICALKSEAAPVVEYFNLERKKTTAPFRIYQGDDADMSLTISGVGRSASASAVQFTYDYYQRAKPGPWINLGVAGHLDLPVGQAVLVKKITDALTGRTWYPSIVIDTALPSCDILTLEKPGEDYQSALFDMECAGFFQCACQVTALELIQVIKIIADNAEQPMDNITPDHISRLIRRNLTAIYNIIEQLKCLSDECRRTPATCAEFNRLTAQQHFTVYQQHQLNALLKKWQVLYPDGADLPERLSTLGSSRAVLAYLLQELEKAPVHITHRHP